MHILITRPRLDAEPLAARLHAQGHTTIIEPLFDIVFRDGAPLDLRNVQALVFTSANGARAAARRTQDRTLPILAVGPTTAAAARDQGFLNISESSGEGLDGLAAHIRATMDPRKGALLHPTGTVTAGDLKASLEPSGFSVRKEEIYDAHAAETLSGALTAELSAGLVDAAMFFSARTAGLFAAMIANASLAPVCGAMAALALSDAVAKALAPLAFRRLLLASKPTADAMLDLALGI